MNHHDAEDLAQRLMAEHGLVEWSFGWDWAKRRFGQCRYADRTITLSRPLVELNSVEHVTETILHEIAHALAGHDAAHGWRWADTAARLGARPEPCYRDDEVDTPAPKYVAYCAAPGCGHAFPRHRPPRATPARYHTPCYDRGHHFPLVWVYAATGEAAWPEEAELVRRKDTR